MVRHRFPRSGVTRALLLIMAAFDHDRATGALSILVRLLSEEASSFSSKSRSCLPTKLRVTAHYLEAQYMQSLQNRHNNSVECAAIIMALYLVLLYKLWGRGA